MSNTIIVKDRMLVPKSLMPKKAVRQRYKIDIFEEASCAKCENKPNRPNDLCRECPALTAQYNLAKETERFWSVPQGDRVALLKVLDKKGIDYRVKDKREPVPFKQPIKWTGKLFGKDFVDENGFPRANQIKVVRDFLEAGEGIIVAPPRSGKSPMAVRIAIKLGNRTVILVHEKRLLTQFYRTFMGDPSKNRAPMSNIRELRKKTGKKIIMIAEKLSDLKKLDDVDILLINYQKMIHDIDRVHEYINGKFSTLILDEVHNSAATSYLRVIANMNVLNRISLSATWRRKDNRHKIMARIQGPVVAKSDSTSLVPTVVYKRSAAVPMTPYRMWQHAISWLYKSKERNVEIVKQVFADLRKGHEVIIIPVEQLAHQKLLVDMINTQAKLNNKKRDEEWPKTLAVAYNAQSNKDKVLGRVDQPGPTVLVPIRKMIKEGVDLARPSMIYVIIPMSASKESDIGSPQFYQLATRVCTPAPKPPPVVRVWIDNVGMFQSCVIGTFFQEIWKKRHSTKNPKGIYHVGEEVYQIIKNVRNTPPPSVNTKTGSSKKKSKSKSGWVR